ncbi:MAG: hypothetical protein D5R96_02720 [Methanocalculus sp. MSAO_Arc2]|uniref:hypothetical protein n=1 Tax=Methanocalculus sp. MSAO_Arc2 TaxID=2293855 RepID=UPI000FF2C95F|nr:MAG: hypothetical protein D5R96_02720 [Methanocalculus sp. MSAO_Arc2]
MKKPCSSEAVANLIGYIIITAVLLVLLVMVMVITHDALIEKPAERLMYHSYVDIGNGISVRIVDIYTIAPENGSITSEINIPHDVLGVGYMITVRKSGVDQEIVVFGDRTEAVISLAGTGVRRPVSLMSTPEGKTMIIYDSRGV